MSDLSRHRPYLIWGVGLVVAAIVAVLALVPTGSWVAMDVRRSSTRVTPDGVAAWARSLERLGVAVAQRYGSFTSEPPRGGGLAILQPVITLSAAEVHATLEWVRGGGTLVYSPTSGGLVMDSLGIDLTFVGTPFGVPVPGRDSLLSHPWTEEGLTGPTSSTWTLEADSVRRESWVPLSVTGDDAELPTLAWLPEGEGGVLVFADAEEIANRALGASVSAVAATRAIVDRMSAGDTLFFSEYHQALDGRGGAFRETYKLAKGSGVGRAILHLAVVAIVLMLLTGRRFGAPFPEAEGERRSTLEHVEALAGIYRAASSHRTAARHLIRGAARRNGGVQASGADPEEEILMAWRARPDLAEPADAALAALRANPPQLGDLERALDTITARHTTTTR